MESTNINMYLATSSFQYPPIEEQKEPSNAVKNSQFGASSIDPYEIEIEYHSGSDDEIPSEKTPNTSTRGSFESDQSYDNEEVKTTKHGKQEVTKETSSKTTTKPHNKNKFTSFPKATTKKEERLPLYLTTRDPNYTIEHNPKAKKKQPLEMNIEMAEKYKLIKGDWIRFENLQITPKLKKELLAIKIADFHKHPLLHEMLYNLACKVDTANVLHFVKAIDECKKIQDPKEQSKILTDIFKRFILMGTKEILNIEKYETRKDIESAFSEEKLTVKSFEPVYDRMKFLFSQTYIDLQDKIRKAKDIKFFSFL